MSPEEEWMNAQWMRHKYYRALHMFRLIGRRARRSSI